MPYHWRASSLISEELRPELVAVGFEVGRVSFRAPALAGAPVPCRTSNAAVFPWDAQPFASRWPLRRAALASLVPISCGAFFGAVLVNHLETDRGSYAPAIAPSQLTRTFQRTFDAARRPAGRPPLQRTLPRPHAEPVIRWTPVAGATHYHVVFWRGDARVLDLWPARPKVSVPREWVHRGTRYRVQPGKYLWLVYPGHGPRSRGHYGPLVAAGVLVVPPRNGG